MSSEQRTVNSSFVCATTIVYSAETVKQTCTAGLLTARGPLRHPLLAWAVEPLTAQLAASALSLPILLFHFGNLSLIAPVANVLMLWAVPYAMLFGAVAVVAGLLWLPLGQLVALLAWPFLHWLLAAARLLAQLPWAATTVPPIGAVWIWGYYAAVAAGCWWLKRRAGTAKHIAAE